MKLRLLLSAAAVCLIAPAMTLAQPQGKGDEKDKKEQGQPKAKGGRAERPTRQAQPQQQPQAQRPAPQPQAQPQPPPQRGGPPERERTQAQRPAPQPQAQPQPQVQRERPQAQRPAPAPQPQPRARPEARPGPQASSPPGRGRGPDGLGPPGQRGGQLARPTGPQPSLSLWQAPPTRGVQRDRSAQEWRQQNQSWDRTAVWRQQPDWWRYDNSFIGYGFSGLRIGFFFVPDRGYISIPRQYRNRQWREGDYLPAWFRAYTVRDPWRYGLPRPPRGCVWIWLNGDIALIDRSDGYILDIAHRVW